jgi:hypothetical protein
MLYVQLILIIHFIHILLYILILFFKPKFPTNLTCHPIYYFHTYLTLPTHLTFHTYLNCFTYLTCHTYPNLNTYLSFYTCLTCHIYQTGTFSKQFSYIRVIKTSQAVMECGMQRSSQIWVSAQQMR